MGNSAAALNAGTRLMLGLAGIAVLLVAIVAAPAIVPGAAGVRVMQILAVLGIVLSLGLALLKARSLGRQLDGVAMASVQIALSHQQLGSCSEAQAVALNESAASVQQLSAAMRRNAGNAVQAGQLAQGASAAAAKGGEAVGQLANAVKGIDDRSRKIADIIDVIDGLAFQTNLIALNAAVEAARAGEPGRGFAVLAAEVRSLTLRSAEAAKEAQSLVCAGLKPAQQGAAAAGRAGAAVAEVAAAIERVIGLIGEISDAGNELGVDVAQLNEAIGRVDRAMQQGAALVAQSAAAAEALSVRAQQLVQHAPSAVGPMRGEAGCAVPFTVAAPASAAAAAVRPERRGPNRARNVTRLAPRADPVLPEVPRPTGTDDDEWAIF